MCNFLGIPLGFRIFFKSLSEGESESRLRLFGEVRYLGAAWFDEFSSSCSPMTGPGISPDSVLFNYIVLHLAATVVCMNSKIKIDLI